MTDGREPRPASRRRCVSGGGTTLQNLLDRIADGSLPRRGRAS